jgi:hypothetical protein
MAWPTPQDYNEAIQSPRLNFSDPELQLGEPEQTSLGLPRPITGNFASVYRVRSGPGDWAVRCFWREYADMQDRYAAISRGLDALRLSYMAEFEYVPRGIKVRGSWYPILKMQWIEGELLNDFVERHLDTPAVIRTLAQRWLEMVTALERASVAHGDLQHGNVLVVNETLRLVDYDGMYVPSLAGKPSHELGHQNYQHPSRSQRDFGPSMDRFSAWVVYLSLVAVAGEPGIWTETRAGDECLLLRKSDFERPAQSTILTLLGDHPDWQVRELTGRFRALLDFEASAIPPLEGSVTRQTGNHRLSRRFLLPLRSVWQTIVPSPGMHLLPVSVAGSSAPSWVVEHVAASAPPHRTLFQPSVRAPRLAVLCALGTPALLFVPRPLLPGPTALSVGLALLLALCCTSLALITSYRRVPEVILLDRVLARERSLQHDLASLSRRVRRLEQQLYGQDSRHSRRLQLMKDRWRHWEAAIHSNQEWIERALKDIIEPLGPRRAELDELELQECSAALTKWREHHVDTTLRGIRLWRAALPEVGWTAKSHLWLRGVRTAYDISVDHVAHLKRLDSPKVRALVAWRVFAEKEANRSAPRHLPTRSRDIIAARYAVHRRRIDRLAAQAQTHVEELVRELSHLSEEIAAQHAAESKVITHAHLTVIQLVERDIDRARSNIPNLNRELADCCNQLPAFEGVTFCAYLKRVLAV